MFEIEAKSAHFLFSSLSLTLFLLLLPFRKNSIIWRFKIARSPTTALEEICFWTLWENWIRKFFQFSSNFTFDFFSLLHYLRKFKSVAFDDHAILLVDMRKFSHSRNFRSRSNRLWWSWWWWQTTMIFQNCRRKSIFRMNVENFHYISKNKSVDERRKHLWNFSRHSIIFITWDEMRNKRNAGELVNSNDDCLISSP